jgi:hypothetical protein
MKFTQTDWTDANGTSLQGYVQAYYHQLVAVFGEPEGGGDKTTVEWCLQFADGTVATIYDWKESETPMGLYRWHIGGRNDRAVGLVQQTFNQNKLVDSWRQVTV